MLAQQYIDLVTTTISALAAKAPPALVEALASRVSTAAERIAEESRDKGPQLDARTLKKLAKAAGAWPGGGALRGGG